MTNIFVLKIFLSALKFRIFNRLNLDDVSSIVVLIYRNITLRVSFALNCYSSANTLMESN